MRCTQHSTTPTRTVLLRGHVSALLLLNLTGQGCAGEGLGRAVLCCCRQSAWPPPLQSIVCPQTQKADVSASPEAADRCGAGRARLQLVVCLTRLGRSAGRRGKRPAKDAARRAARSGMVQDLAAELAGAPEEVGCLPLACQGFKDLASGVSLGIGEGECKVRSAKMQRHV